jgi:hypothetical protein
VMAALAKNNNKQNTVTKTSQSFVDSVSKREFVSSIDLVTSNFSKYGAISSFNEENYRSMLTRNLPKNIKEDCSHENMHTELTLKKKMNLESFAKKDSPQYKSLD